MHVKRRDSLKLKKSKFNNKSKLGKSKHKLNNSASVKRGVAKIFKGFKIGKRRSAAYKLMHKRSSKAKNAKKSGKSKSKNVTLKNARMISNKRSFTQLAAKKYFNKYKRYQLKKARIHFHPSNKYKKFKNNLKSPRLNLRKKSKLGRSILKISKSSRSKLTNNKFKGRKSVKKVRRK